MGLRGPKKGDPRCKVNGRKGAEALKEMYGPEHFRSAGRKGGEVTRTKYGREYYAQIGRKGGEALKQKQEGTDYYSAISRGIAPSKKEENSNG